MNKSTSFRQLVSILAAGLVLASCNKESVTFNSDSEILGATRTIAVSFQDSPTKTVLDGFLPKFVAGDQIRVSDGSASEDCTVAVSGGVATIRTTLLGELTAVYPATAAKMNESNTNQIDGIKVPTVQDGSFASANICRATIEEDAASATFVNQTAVLKITPGAGADTKYVEVTALSDLNIANDVPGASIFTNLSKIHVNSTSADAVYVSILVPSGLKISDLSFADGSNLKGLNGDDTEVSSNTIYDISSSGWDHSYVEIGSKKWATMNVGATTVAGSPDAPWTCYGDYFAWGDPEPYYSSMSFTSATDASFSSWKTGKETGYVWQSYCGSNSFTEEWDPAPYDATSKTLTSSYDVATVIWGNPWRTPTSEDIQSLYIACNGNSGVTNIASSTPDGGVYWLPEDQDYLSAYTGVAGLLFVSSSDTSKMVFFPAAGVVVNTMFVGGFIEYWSSSVYTDFRGAYCLAFAPEYISWFPGFEARYTGCTVRAVSE